MSKRRSFEEILDSEFRWPTQCDKAFVASANSSENANIDESGHSRLVLMTDGYKKAGDLMVEAAGHDKLARDTLVFPIILNYRHFLEISLKYLLATYGPAGGLLQAQMPFSPKAQSTTTSTGYSRHWRHGPRVPNVLLEINGQPRQVPVEQVDGHAAIERERGLPPRCPAISQSRVSDDWMR